MMLTDDERWLLTQAARPEGLIVHAKAAKDLAVNLEARGWLRPSDRGPVWLITDEGRTALSDTTNDQGMI